MKNHPVLKFLGIHLNLTPEAVEALDQAGFDTAVQGLKVLPTAEFTTLSQEHTERGTQVQTLTQERDTAKQSLTTVQEQVQQLTQEKTTNAPLVAAGQSHLTQLREATKNAYVKFAKGNPDATILAELNTADVVSLEAKAKMWGHALHVGFAAHCTKCESGDHISMRSSVEPEGEGRIEKPQHESVPLWERFQE